MPSTTTPIPPTGVAGVPVADLPCGCQPEPVPALTWPVGADPDRALADAVTGLRAGVADLLRRARAAGVRTRPWALHDGGFQVVASFSGEPVPETAEARYPTPSLFPVLDLAIYGRICCPHDDFGHSPLLPDTKGKPRVPMCADTGRRMPQTGHGLGALQLWRENRKGKNTTVLTGGWAPAATTADQIATVTALVEADRGAPDLATLYAWGVAASHAASPAR